MSELREKLDDFMELYNELKNEIRRERKFEYQRWKAGGFIVDDDVMSMYPNIVTILETMCAEEEQDDLADSIKDEYDEDIKEIGNFENEER